MQSRKKLGSVPTHGSSSDQKTLGPGEKANHSEKTPTTPVGASTTEQSPPSCHGADLSVANSAMGQAKDALDTATSALANPNSARLELAEKWFGVLTSSEAVALRDMYVRARAFADGASFFLHNRNEFKKR